MSLQTTTASQPSAFARSGSPPSDASAAAVARQPRAAGEMAEHQGLGLALILVAAFMVVLDFSIVNVALPSIEREFGFSAAAVQWVVTGYAIAFGGLLILGGRAADLLGRRRMFIAGLLAFSAAWPEGSRRTRCCWSPPAWSRAPGRRSSRLPRSR